VGLEGNRKVIVCNREIYVLSKVFYRFKCMVNLYCFLLLVNSFTVIGFLTLY